LIPKCRTAETLAGQTFFGLAVFKNGNFLPPQLGILAALASMLPNETILDLADCQSSKTRFAVIPRKEKNGR
jgi:hypothetical protein